MIKNDVNHRWKSEILPKILLQIGMEIALFTKIILSVLLK